VKNPKKKTKAIGRDTLVHEWQPLFAAIKDVIDWALDIAKKLSRDYVEDIEAIERVRTSLHAWLDGRPCAVDVSDVLLTIATILAQIEIDLGIGSDDMLAPLRALDAKPSRLPRALGFPGATRDELDTVVIRRFPGRRNGGCLFTQLAA
jgi:hypothetical protein